MFDASAKTASGVSLNETVGVGPTIQDELIDIILRFCLHNVVIIADIHKMYRQIHIDSSEQNYQCIVWRSSPKEKIKDYTN